MKGILLELKELLFDEEPLVKIEAFNVLADVFKNCQYEVIIKSQLVKVVCSIFEESSNKKMSIEFLAIIIE